MGVLNKKIFAGFALFFILILSVFFVVSKDIIKPNFISYTAQTTTSISPVQCVKDSDCGAAKKCADESTYYEYKCYDSECEPIMFEGGSPCFKIGDLTCPDVSTICDGTSLYCNKTGTETLYKKCRYGCKTGGLCCNGDEIRRPGQCVVPEPEPITGSCKEAILGHNDINENRVNIVFVGFNYADIDSFKFFVQGSIDSDSNGYGLLSIEPFKSNKEKFNFWYVDKVQSLEWSDNTEINKKMATLPLLCNYTNQENIALYNGVLNNGAGYFLSTYNLSVVSIADKRIKISDIPENCSKENVDLNNDSCISLKDMEICDALDNCHLDCFQFLDFGCPYQFDSVPTDLRDNSYITNYNTVVHEFGHAFAGLDDEYKMYSGEFPFQEGKFLNCFIASSQQECINNAPWKDFLGKDCGNESIIDCNTTSSKYSYEIGCFEGCKYATKGIYRPTLLSVMGGQNTSNLDIKNTIPYSFRLVNERYLCQQFIKETGSVGGYCDKFNLSPLGADSADLGSDAPNNSLGNHENESISPETGTPKINSFFNALISFFRNIFSN